MPYSNKVINGKVVGREIEVLKEITDNPVVKVETYDDDKKPLILDIDFVTRKEIIKDYFEGMEVKDIADKWGIPKRTVQTIIEKSDQLRMDIERRYFAVNAARENVRIANTKNKMLNYVDETIDEARSNKELTTKDKLKTIQNVSAMLDRLDRSYRLNNNMPTSSSETTHKVVDVAKILEQFKTPEEKMLFLQRNNEQQLEGDS